MEFLKGKCNVVPWQLEKATHVGYVFMHAHLNYR